MSTETSNKAMRISLVNDQEIRIQTYPNNRISQKIVSETGGPSDMYFNEELINEIGSYLTDSVYLRKKFKKRVRDLEYALYRPVDDAPQEVVAFAMLRLLRAWTIMCSEDKKCIPLPSREQMNDPTIVRTIQLFNELRTGSVPKLEDLKNEPDEVSSDDEED